MTTPLRTISANDLKVILADHRLWIGSDGTQGKRADLSGADLSGADLSGADLRDASLHCADLTRADLSEADLSGASLFGADLRDANLFRADLSGANLYGADLSGVNLRDANLHCADLCGANLSRADLTEANLEGAQDLPDFQRCPRGGSFKAFKKVCIGAKEYVLELEVPADAKRVSSTGTKCRASKAKVLKAMNLDGTPVDGADGMVFQSFHARFNGFSFTYQVGKEVSVQNFDGDIRVECAPGIHFFMEFKEAKNYRH